MDIAYNGVWGYHPLVVSLANTGEPLYLVNRRVTFRGDTDFTQTRHLDRWDADGVRFVFGCDARANLIAQADALPARAWTRLVRPAPYAVQTTPRARPANVKAATIVARGFKNLALEAEAVAEFPYQPTWCRHAYRIVVLRKTIAVTRGAQRLFDEVRYFFLSHKES